MGNGYVVPPTDALDQLRQILMRARTRLAELEALDGSQIYNTVQELRKLVEGLIEQTEVNVSGSVTAGGTVTAGGDITTSSGYVYSTAGYGFDLTYTRRDLWIGNDGRMAWASSTREKKQDIRDAVADGFVDPLAVLQIASKVYHYRAEVAKRDDPSSPEYVGPDYHVALEFGAIAEELHDLGLWMVVAYDDDHRTPVSIHYSMLSLLAIEATKHVWSRHLQLEERVERLERALTGDTK